jgi:hypothetical protein
VTADPVLARELKSLQEELSASQRGRLSPSTHRASASDGTVAPAAEPEDTAEERTLRGEIGELVNVITEFVEEAEKDVSAHPAASMVGALVVGILIGRLLGRS